MNKEFFCKICKKLFNFSDRKPFSNSCGRSICKSCWEEYDFEVTCCEIHRYDYNDMKPNVVLLDLMTLANNLYFDLEMSYFDLHLLKP